VAGGEITPTLKVKHAMVMATFNDLIEEINAS
jgi:hypothetical protein